MLSTTGRTVSTAETDPSSSVIRRIASIDYSEPRSTSSETSTIRNGKIESTE